MSYTAGYEAVLAYQTESTTTGGYGFTTTAPAIPASPVVIGYAHTPEVKTERESKKGYSIGSPYAVFNGKGTRKYSVNVDVALTDGTLLQKFNRGSGGYKDLADLALFVGTSNTFGSGAARVIRMAKCNTYTLDLKEGSAQEVRMQATFMGLFEQDATAISPSESDLVAAGAPYFWNNVITCSVGENELRDVISAIKIEGNNNLSQRGFRPGADDSDPLHLTNYALLPGNFTGKATLTFHEPLSDALRKATENATFWGDIEIAMSYGDKDMTVTLKDCLLDADYQNAVEDGSEAMKYGCEIQFSELTVS